MSFSSITGFGADIIVVDDAHDIENVESNVIREAALRVWDEVLPTQLNDPKIGMFIVIMQRSRARLDRAYPGQGIRRDTRLPAR